MVELHEIAPVERYILRGPGGALGLGLPEEPCRAADNWALWLGPDEWLLFVPGGGGAGLASRVAGAVGERPYALVDVSHRQVGLELRGPDAATLLNGAVPLDLREAVFPVGMCVRTLFEKAEIVLWRRGVEAWRIEVARSYAPYVRALLGAIAAADGTVYAPTSPR